MSTRRAHLTLSKGSQPRSRGAMFYRTDFGAIRRKKHFMKILVVDDHTLIREALRDVLKEVRGDATVFEASTCREGMELVAEHGDLRLIVLDLNLPDRDGFSALSELRERYPAISVVVLSGVQDRDTV